MIDILNWKAAAAVFVVVAVAGFAAFSNPAVQGELKAWTGAAPDNPSTVYGYLPVSADSGLLDFGSLMIAGEAPSQDATAPQYRCHDNSYYIDQDGERGVQYYSGDHISGDAGYYFYGYDKSYSYAEICGGRYNYQCEMGSGCEGFVEDDGGDSGGGSDGSSGGNDDGSSGSNEDSNEPPEIQSIDTPSTVNASQPFTVAVEASDPDSPGLTYSWSNGKEGQSIILNYGETGVKELDVTVSDGAGNTATSTVRVNVVEQEEAVNPIEPPERNVLQRFWDWFTGLFE